jgi:hypothetical protein
MRPAGAGGARVPRHPTLTGTWRLPVEATIRRVLARVDSDTLDQASRLASRPAATPSNPPPPATQPAWRPAIAVDGKSCAAAATPNLRSTCPPRWTKSPVPSSPDDVDHTTQRDRPVTAAAGQPGPCRVGWGRPTHSTRNMSRPTDWSPTSTLLTCWS